MAGMSMAGSVKSACGRAFLPEQGQKDLLDLDLRAGFVAFPPGGFPARRPFRGHPAEGLLQLAGRVVCAVIAVKARQRSPGFGPVLLCMDVHQRPVQVENVVFIGKFAHNTPPAVRRCFSPV